MLRILHLEDRREDAFLVEQALSGAGIQASIRVARNQLEFASALDHASFDLILADSGLPDFSGIEALTLARGKQPGIGFICVSGAVADDRVSAHIDAGATDWISKDKLALLAASVRREQERLNSIRTNRAMSRLVTAVQELSHARDLDSIMAVVRRAARELTGADGATFVLRDGDLCHYADEDAIEPLWKGQRFPMSACISGWVMLNRQPAVIEDIYADPRIPADAYRPTFVRSLAMVPIRTEAPLGAIGNYWAALRPPEPEAVALLQALANTTAVAMENVKVRHELEQRVKDRTEQLESVNAKLETSNRELEAFSHAVSHDLGAPLRSIRAYADMTQKECGIVLGPKGKEWLSRIQSSASQMRTLMDDLLRLSKVTRTRLGRQRVDLTALARDIIGRMSLDSPDRRVDVRIASGLEASGDPGLLRIAIENLLSNAWKYTEKCPQARIEFGSNAQPDGSTVYYVRDNGAGFDMSHAGKLFQPFQRLHDHDQFPGSGIGLTTVQRIIQRHGGRIWAEGRVDHGAAFHFTV